MKKEEKTKLVFYRCSVCGNLMIKLEDSGLDPQCCGRDMTVLSPNCEEEFGEKHSPVWRMNGCKLMIQVGEVLHPMSDKHYIQWIIVETNLGHHLRRFTCEESPEVTIALSKGEAVVDIYSFCNIHGLWMSEGC